MAAITTRKGAVIDDRRTDEDIVNTACFVVAQDSFLSGWGNAPGRSYFAVPCKSMEQARIVEDNMRHRSEMKRVRIRWVSEPIVTGLRHGDHLSIRDMSDCNRFYKAGGFRE